MNNKMRVSCFLILIISNVLNADWNNNASNNWMNLEENVWTNWSADDNEWAAQQLGIPVGDPDLIQGTEQDPYNEFLPPLEQAQSVNNIIPAQSSSPHQYAIQGHNIALPLYNIDVLTQLDQYDQALKYGSSMPNYTEAETEATETSWQNSEAGAEEMPESEQAPASFSHVGESSRYDAEPDTSMMTIGDINKRRVLTEAEKAEIASPNCHLRLSSLPENHGMILDSQRLLQYPTFHDYYLVPTNHQITISCEESSLALEGQDLPLSDAYLLCVNGSLLFYDRPLKTHEYACIGEQMPFLKAVRPGGKGNTMCNGLAYFSTGLNVRASQPLHEFCVEYKRNVFYEQEAHVEFVLTELDAKLLGQEAPGEFRGFYSDENDTFHGSILERLYMEDAVKASLERQLGTDMYNRLTQNGTHYITPGLLAARFDHVYRMQQNGALYWANVKPMWSTLVRNWNAVEIAVSKFASVRNGAIRVYSGTQGAQKFRNNDQEDWTFLYLGKKDNGLDFQPVPEIFYKLVTNFTTKCVAIIGHNTPERSMTRICRDRTKDVPWLDNLDADYRSGIVYACSCRDFDGSSYIPKMSGLKLLRK